jgi:hypothetical protein
MDAHWTWMRQASESLLSIVILLVARHSRDDVGKE